MERKIDVIFCLRQEACDAEKQDHRLESLVRSVAEEIEEISDIRFHGYSEAHSLSFHNNHSTPNALVIMEAPGRKFCFNCFKAIEDVRARLANAETITLLHRQFSNRFYKTPRYRRQWLPLQMRKFQLDRRPMLMAFFESIDFSNFPDFFPEDLLGPMTHWYQLQESGYPVLDYETPDERDAQLRELSEKGLRKLVQNM